MSNQKHKFEFETILSGEVSPEHHAEFLLKQYKSEALSIAEDMLNEFDEDKHIIFWLKVISHLKTIKTLH